MGLSNRVIILCGVRHSPQELDHAVDVIADLGVRFDEIEVCVANRG